MRHVCTLALSTLMILIATPASAANLIVNGNFDTSVDDWSSDPLLTSFWFDTSLDAGGSNDSGSLAMSSAVGANAALAVIQCIGSLPGSEFSFGVKIRPNLTNVFGMSCSAYSSTDCSGVPLGSANAQGGVADPNGWVPMRTATPFVLPGGTQSVSCAITAAQPLERTAVPQPHGLLVAIWADDAFFAPGTTPVSLQSFEID